MTIYCANDPCESEATHVVEETMTPLCWTCHEAYTWGQASPTKHVVELASIDTDDLAFLDGEEEES